MIVAKVGGSLYDDPRLGRALRAWVTEQNDTVLLVPGGGDFADAVRNLDRIHGLGEEAAHYLALTSLWAAMQFLKCLLPEAEFASHPTHPLCSSSGRTHILDPEFFCKIDSTLPHAWKTTSDSISARCAIVGAASRLVLLKSIDIPPCTPWAVAAERGWVDAYFPELLSTAAVPVEVVNFRKWIENRFPNTSDRLS